MNPKELDNLLSSKKLSYDKKIADFQFERNQSRYVLIINDQKRKYIFKGLINQNDQDRNSFIKDIHFIKNLSNLSAPFKTNTIIDSGDKPSLWIILDYIEGQVSGNIFEYNKSFINNNFLASIFSSIEWLQKNPPKNVLKDNKTFSLWLEKNAKKIIDHDYFKINLNSIKRVINYLQKYSLDKKNIFFAHNDLSPLNVIIRNKEISIIDWEMSGFNIAPFDLAYCFQRAWRYPIFQKMILEKISVKKEVSFKKAFMGLILIFLCIDLITFQKALNGFKFKHGQEFSQDYLQELENIYQEKISFVIEEFNK